MIHMRHMIPIILVEHMIEMVHDVHMQILPTQWENLEKTIMFEPPGAQNVRDAYETYMTSDTYVLFFLF